MHKLTRAFSSLPYELYFVDERVDVVPDEGGETCDADVLVSFVNLNPPQNGVDWRTLVNKLIIEDGLESDTP